MKFEDFLEAINYNTPEVTIQQGEILYHGTIESFDTRKPQVSPYDKIFWTTDDIMVARSYIPSQSSYFNTTINSIIQNKQHEEIRQSIGLSKKIINTAWEKYKKNYEIYKFWDDKHKEYSAQWQQIKTQKDHENQKELDDFFEKWITAENNAKNALKSIKYAEDYLKTFVAHKLKIMGYSIENNYIRKIITDQDGKLLPANQKRTGKVLKVICNRNFKVYNYAYNKEGDLTNVDYHKTNLFRKIEDKGYDGIIINDFAQSDYHGNYGHRSIGFFKHSLKDLTIKQIRSQTHPDDSEWK